MRVQQFEEARLYVLERAIAGDLQQAVEILGTSERHAWCGVHSVTYGCLAGRPLGTSASREETVPTALGSKWTAAERDELQKLYDAAGRSGAVAKFTAAYPHRTRASVLYQIDRNLTKAS